MILKTLPLSIKLYAIPPLLPSLPTNIFFPLGLVCLRIFVAKGFKLLLTKTIKNISHMLANSVSMFSNPCLCKYYSNSITLDCFKDILHSWEHHIIMSTYSCMPSKDFYSLLAKIVSKSANKFLSSDAPQFHVTERIFKSYPLFSASSFNTTIFSLYGLPGYSGISFSKGISLLFGASFIARSSKNWCFLYTEGNIMAT